LVLKYLFFELQILFLPAFLALCLINLDSLLWRFKQMKFDISILITAVIGGIVGAIANSYFSAIVMIEQRTSNSLAAGAQVRFLSDQGVVGSNPVAPAIKKH
jgi:hypothetical protein